LKQTRGAGLKNLQPAALAQTEFGETPDGGGLAAHLGHLGKFTGGQHVQR
jgi:hypothetical protein